MTKKYKKTVSWILEKMIGILQENLNNFPKIQPQRPVFVIGNTGAGKSTLVAYLMNMPLKKSKPRGAYELIFDHTHEIFPKDPEELKKFPTISAGMDSETKSPGFFHRDKDFFLVDFPGFGDTRGKEADIINSMMMQIVAGMASGVKLVIFVLDSIKFMQGRDGIGDHLSKSAAVLRSILKNPKDKLSQGFLKFVVSKMRMDDYEDQKEALNDIETRLRDFVNATNNHESKEALAKFMEKAYNAMAVPVKWLISAVTKSDPEEDQKNSALANTIADYMLYDFDHYTFAPDLLDAKDESFKNLIKEDRDRWLRVEDFTFDQYLKQIERFINAIGYHFKVKKDLEQKLISNKIDNKKHYKPIT